VATRTDSEQQLPNAFAPELSKHPNTNTTEAKEHVQKTFSGVLQGFESESRSREEGGRADCQPAGI
jgi:hypothetical protein